MRIVRNLNVLRLVFFVLGRLSVRAVLHLVAHSLLAHLPLLSAAPTIPSLLLSMTGVVVG